MIKFKRKEHLCVTNITYALRAYSGSRLQLQLQVFHPSNSYIIPNVDNINTMNKIFADNLGSNKLLGNSGS